MSALLSNQELAEAIQRANYDEDPSANAWSCSYLFIQFNNHWYKIHFNHVRINGFDAWKLFVQNRDKLLCQSNESDHINRENNINIMTIEENVCWIERLDTRPDGVFYQGPPNIRSKEITQNFAELNEGPFYLPINMSETLGSAALLNYTFDESKDFESNWQEIIRLKNNENHYLQENDRWKSHVRSQLHWVSLMWLKGERWPIFFRYYDYDVNDLQGLGVISTDDASYWTFSFFHNPQMKEEFIKRYNLVPYV